MSLRDQLDRVSYTPVIGNYLSNQDRSLLQEPAISAHLEKLGIQDPKLVELYMLCVMLRMQDPVLHPLRVRMMREHPAFMLLLRAGSNGNVTSLTRSREAVLHSMFDQTAQVIWNTVGFSFEPTNYSAQYLAVEQEE